jgi:DNA-directed RNA polymerase specialized sigma24 family protein
MTQRPLGDDDDFLLEAIQQVRLGDQGAFEVIYNYCIVRVKGLCRCRLCASDRGMQIEEDLSSEVMTLLWQSLCDPDIRWQTCDELWHVLYRLVFERSTDRGKYNMRKKRRSDLNLAQLFSEIYGHRVSANGIAEVDAEDLVAVLVGSLPDEESKECIELKLAGATNDELAKRWQVTVRTVRRKVQYIREIYNDKIANEAGK